MDSDLRSLIRALPTLSPEERTALFQKTEWILLPRQLISTLKLCLIELVEKPNYRISPRVLRVLVRRNGGICIFCNQWAHQSDCFGIKFLEELKLYGL